MTNTHFAVNNIKSKCSYRVSKREIPSMYILGQFQVYIPKSHFIPYFQGRQSGLKSVGADETFGDFTRLQDFETSRFGI